MATETIESFHNGIQMMEMELDPICKLKEEVESIGFEAEVVTPNSPSEADEMLLNGVIPSEFDYMIPGSPDSASSYSSIASRPSSPGLNMNEQNTPPCGLKSALKRPGTQPHRPSKSVRWHSDVVFETRSRPNYGKRPRPNSNSRSSSDEELKAPVAKRARVIDIESNSSAMTTNGVDRSAPIFPMASRSILPSFNFSSSTIQQQQQTSSGDAASSVSFMLPSLSTPVCFSFGGNTKRRQPSYISSIHPVPIYQSNH